jgi:hypothetical protein
MTLHPPHEKEQLSAIEIKLATAPKIQEDLKAEYGYGENKFFYLDLIEYRINNSLLDIAEDLDLEERYGLTTDEVAGSSVSSAFRGHHDEDFLPEYQFNGLLGKVTNDMIEKIRKKKGGQISKELGLGFHGRTPEEHSEHSRKVADMINPETGVRYVVEASRKGNEAQGNYSWSLEEIVEIGELKYGEGLTWKDTTSEMNEKYDKDFTTVQVKKAYHRNKDLLTDEEE